MDKQRLQQPLHVVERVTHTGETGKSTDTCINSTILIKNEDSDHRYDHYH